MCSLLWEKQNGNYKIINLLTNCTNIGTIKSNNSIKLRKIEYMKFIKIIPIYFYKEVSGNEPVRKWLKELSVQERKIIGKDIRRVQIDWPVGSPLVKSLGSKIWEVRSSLDNRIARILFIFEDSTIILLHGFIKKTQKTPTADIDVAKQRAKNLENNGG